MRVWVTRASPGADRTADRLRAMGRTPLVDPVLTVREVPAAVSLEGVAALAFTSANGLDAFVRRSDERALPVFAVGDATAEAARRAGFADVRSAGGDVEALGRLIAGAGLPAGAVVLSPGGRERAGDLGAAVGPGVQLRNLTLYETTAREPAEALAALASGGIEAVLLHAPGAARRVAALCAPWKTSDVRWLAMSPAIARPLREAGYGRVEAAPFPDEPSLLKLLPRKRSGQPGMTDAPTDPAPAPEEPGTAPARPVRRRSGAAVGLLAFLAVGLLVAAALALWAPRMASRLRTAPAQTPAAAASAPEEAALRARIADLERALAEARAKAAERPPAAGLDPAAAAAILARVERLEQAQARSARAASAAVAAAALADAAVGSRPFAGELAALEALSPERRAIAGLRPLAARGVPSRAALAAEFPDVAARAAAASRSSEADTSLLARAGAALRSLFTVRRVDDLSGASPDAILARAEVRIADGDLEGALQQLALLPEGGQAATAAWREKARRRIEVERRISELRTLALKDLSEPAQ